MICLMRLFPVDIFNRSCSLEGKALVIPDFLFLCFLVFFVLVGCVPDFLVGTVFTFCVGFLLSARSMRTPLLCSIGGWNIVEFE